MEWSFLFLSWTRVSSGYLDQQDSMGRRYNDTQYTSHPCCFLFHYFSVDSVWGSASCVSLVSASPVGTQRWPGWDGTSWHERREGRDGSFWACCEYRQWLGFTDNTNGDDFKHGWTLILLFVGQGVDGHKGEKGDCRLDDNLVSAKYVKTLSLITDYCHSKQSSLKENMLFACFEPSPSLL